MKLRFKILLIVLLGFYGSVTAQELKLIRTDVDTLRSHFVTATYIFGFDVVAQNVKKCNGVTFELQYNQVQYVKLSEWRTIGFGDNATAVVIPQENYNTGEGLIHIGVLSGDLLSETTFDDPRVIHLEFAVLQSAPDGETLTFNFLNAKAVTRQDSAGSIIELNTEPFLYTLHSFVNVWPGDADNNGEVNTDDVAQIGYYLGLGPDTKSMRSFKRPSGSTLWSPQRVLAWDSASATYADCDGNGNITIMDALVVSLNFARTHTVSLKKDDKPSTQETRKFAEPTYMKDGRIAVPVYINVQEPSMGIYASIRLKPEDAGKLAGIERGDLFPPGSSFFIYDMKDGCTEIIFASTDNMSLSRKSGVAAYLIFEKDAGNPGTPEFNEAFSVTPAGLKMPAGILSSINEDYAPDGLPDLSCSEGVLRVKPVGNDELRIFDYFGNILLSRYDLRLESGEAIIDLSGMPAGIYIARLGVRSLIFAKY